MSSVNISITEDVYEMLKRRKKEDESFSDVIRELAGQKDIRKCYGLLKEYAAELEEAEQEILKDRKKKWREIEI